MRYDAEVSPRAEDWLALDEGERLAFVTQHHKRLKVRAGNLQVHCAVHVTVETQLAEGYGVTIRAMERLLGDGLGRHDAIHAIGSVVAEQIFAAMQGQPFNEAQYAERLSSLTASSWRSSGSTEGDE